MLVMGNLPKKYLGEEQSELTKTEQQGYVSTKKQIEAFVYAGKRLKAAKAEMYDCPDGEIKEVNDPTRSKNFDLADASMIKNTLEAKAEAAKEAKKAAKAAAEKQEKLDKEAAKKAAEEKPAE